MEEAEEARKEASEGWLVAATSARYGVEAWRRWPVVWTELITTLPTCSEKTSAKGSNLMIAEPERGWQVRDQHMRYSQ